MEFSTEYPERLTRDTELYTNSKLIYTKERNDVTHNIRYICRYIMSTNQYDIFQISNEELVKLINFYTNLIDSKIIDILDVFQKITKHKINKVDMHKIIIVYLQFLFKMYDDIYYSNKFMAEFSSITLYEFNTIETILGKILLTI